MKRVLILCTGNSCRSQMAEALWRLHGDGNWEAVSAGSDPAGYVHPLAIQAMQDLNVDISSYESKTLQAFMGQPFDLVVTVCDNARHACPVFPGVDETLHWPFDDPAEAEGDEASQLREFQRVRDEISARIHEYLAVAATD